MPENPYFRDPKIQNSLLNIIFVYCKLNEDVSYRQGMHEILAVVLWVVSCDAITPGFSIDAADGQSAYEEDSIIAETLDAGYIEHDSFSLFQVIMRSAKAWYELGEEGSMKNRGGSENRTSSPIVEKSKYIHEHLLMSVDPELAEHLKALDVLPQVFLMYVLFVLFYFQGVLISGLVDGFDCCLVENFLLKNFSRCGIPFSQRTLICSWWTIYAWRCFFEFVGSVGIPRAFGLETTIYSYLVVMEADYSTALTLVLRYPSPNAPDLPATFVADAIYIRDNPTFAGGKHIITKYSNRAPSAPPRKKTTPKFLRKNSPMGSSTRFLQAGQLETMVQDVAKNVLNQGERWGVNRAVRDAVVDLKKNVQGFQQSQQQQQQWADQESAREAEVVKRSRELSKRLKVDEERRVLMGGLLQLSIDELEKDDLGADQKKIALQRLRHVRECLLDSSKAVEPFISQAASLSGEPGEVPLPPSPAVRSSLFRSASAASPPTRRVGQLSPPASIQVTKAPLSPQGAFVKTSFKNNSDPDFLTHRPRASLAQSSFSWMLGDDPAAKTRTAFVSPSNKASSAGGGGADGSKVDGMWSPDADEGFDLGHLRRKR